MRLRKFFGPTSRSVLEQIRTELGPDAVIVANHPTSEGVEISALAGDAMDTLLGAVDSPARRAKPAAATPPPSATERRASGEASRQRTAVAPQEAKSAEAAVPPPAQPPSPIAAPAPAAAAVPGAEPTSSAAPFTDGVAAVALAESSAVEVRAPQAIRERAFRDDETTLAARLMKEIAAMRSLLEGQLAQLAWSDAARRKPLCARLTQELIAFGFSPALARGVTQRLPDDYTAAQAQQWLQGVIAKNIRCVDPADDIVARGGVYALVGPTGVGKTTTAAKLAARCAVRHGSSSLALLTTDSYRVGAQDQLRIYAKILGIGVQTVNDAGDVANALDSLRAKHLVLIDTVGMSQRDTRVAEHAMILAQPQVHRLLLLNAAAQAETLEEVVNAYGAGSAETGRTLDGCIISKQDESARPAQVLDVIIRHRLRVHYVSNGQRVPEDLQPANAAYLAHRALKPVAQGLPFRLSSDEVPLVLAAAGAAYV